MNEVEYATLMAYVAALWPHSKITTETIEAGERFLLSFPADVVRAAVESFVAEGAAHAPTIPMLYQRAATFACDEIPDVDEAWAEVRREIRRVGRTRGVRGGREPEWSHALVGEVVDRFGWDALCDSENEVADRAHWSAMYREARARLLRDQAAPPTVKALRQGRSEFARLGDVVRKALPNSAC